MTVDEVAGADPGGLGLPSEVEEIRVASVPLRVRFRGVTHREAVLLRGSAGWGEFSPFREYDDATSLPWLRSALEAARLPYPPPVRSRVPVNVTVPAVGPVAAHGIVARSGCATAKVKVAEPGQSLDEERARLEAVRDALGASGSIRVDANAAWSREEALRVLPVLDRAAGGLEYAEQPCASVEDLAYVRRRLDIPIAADESIRRSDDPMRVVRAEAADVVVLKVQPLGGVRACLRLAEEVGLPVVVSSALETSVGIAAGVALAAALPELNHACGLATVGLAEKDVAVAPLLPAEGLLPAGRVEVSGEAVRLCAVPSDVRDWWLARVARVAALLA